MRATLATREAFGGQQRKLAWFVLLPNGLYFEAGGIFRGSHTSYHVDGNLWRTSPATQNRPRFQGRYLALRDFRGWHQFGTSMITRTELSTSPRLTSRDQKPGSIVELVSVPEIGASAVNLVTELVHKDSLGLEERPDFQPPRGAVVSRIGFGDLRVLITTLATENCLLVRPDGGNFVVSHFNARYSANAPGVTYTYEAYGEDPPGEAPGGRKR